MTPASSSSSSPHHQGNNSIPSITTTTNNDNINNNNNNNTITSSSSINQQQKNNPKSQSLSFDFDDAPPTAAAATTTTTTASSSSSSATVNNHQQQQQQDNIQDSSTNNNNNPHHHHHQQTHFTPLPTPTTDFFSTPSFPQIASASSLPSSSQQHLQKQYARHLKKGMETSEGDDLVFEFHGRSIGELLGVASSSGRGAVDGNGLEDMMYLGDAASGMNGASPSVIIPTPQFLGGPGSGAAGGSLDVDAAGGNGGENDDDTAAETNKMSHSSSSVETSSSASGVNGNSGANNASSSAAANTTTTNATTTNDTDAMSANTATTTQSSDNDSSMHQQHGVHQNDTPQLLDVPTPFFTPSVFQEEEDQSSSASVSNNNTTSTTTINGIAAHPSQYNSSNQSNRSNPDSSTTTTTAPPPRPRDGDLEFQHHQQKEKMQQRTFLTCKKDNYTIVSPTNFSVLSNYISLIQGFNLPVKNKVPGGKGNTKECIPRQVVELSSEGLNGLDPSKLSVKCEVLGFDRKANKMVPLSEVGQQPFVQTSDRDRRWLAIFDNCIVKHSSHKHGQKLALRFTLMDRSTNESISFVESKSFQTITQRGKEKQRKRKKKRSDDSDTEGAAADESNSERPRKRRRKNRALSWTVQELRNLLDGHEKYDHSWDKILVNYQFEQKTISDLEDKFEQLFS